MTAQDDPYVRVYYRVMSDPKFRGLSLAAWGLWTRLLIVGDGLHPAPAPLPRWTEDAPLKELVDAQIIDMEGEDFYTIHGLKSERQNRSEKAAIGGRARADGAQRAPTGQFRNAATAGDEPPTADIEPATAGEPPAGSQRQPASPLRSSPSHSTPNRAAPSLARTGSDDVWSVANVLSELTGYTPSPKVTEDLKADVANLGVDRVRAAIEQAHAAGPGPFDAATLFYAAHRLLMPMTTTERLTPAERKQRERDDYLARTRAEMEAAKAAQA